MSISGKTSSLPPPSTTNDCSTCALPDGISCPENAGGAWTRQHGARPLTNLDAHLDAITVEKTRRGIDHVHDQVIPFPMRLAKMDWRTKRLFGEKRSARGVHPALDAQMTPDPQFGLEPGDTALFKSAKNLTAFRPIASSHNAGFNEKIVSASQPSSSSRPCPDLRSANSTGLLPRISLASRAITPRSAPTWGARRDFIDEERSLFLMAGPPFLGNLVSFGDVDDVDERVNQFRERTWPTGCRRRFQ